MMPHLIDLLTSFNVYASGGQTRGFLRHFSYYENKMSEFDRDFNHTKINNQEIKAIVKVILTTLGIPAHQHGRYLNSPLSVRDFFVELNEHTKKENLKLNNFIILQNQQNRLKWNKIILGSAIGLAIFEITYPFIKSLITIQELLAAALFVPVVGIGITAIIAIYSGYKNIFDKHTSLSQRFKDNFFLLADIALKLAAYSLLIAATTATPVAAALFVVAECFNVIKEIVNLVQAHFQNNNNAMLSSMDVLSRQQYKARQQFDFVKQRNSIIINLLAATLCVGIIAIWCFFPPSLFLTIGALAAVAVVAVIKAQIQKCNEANVKTRLNREFTKLEASFVTEQESNEEAEDLVAMAIPGGTGLELTEREDDSLLPHSGGRSRALSRPSECGMFSGRAGGDSSTTRPGAALMNRSLLARR
jgi:hypothetical protein